MIYFDESTVKVGGVVLPGLFKSIEVKTATQMEEANMEGKSSKPKQATGYEDAKINLELSLEDSPEQTALEKLKVIQNLFRKPGQGKPTVYEIVSEHTAARGIRQVIFKDISTKEQNKKSEISVSIEFWEYIAITITASKTSGTTSSKSNSSGSSSSSSASVGNDYKNYLPDRGKAPNMKDKTSNTAASDTTSAFEQRKKLNSMPY